MYEIEKWKWSRSVVSDSLRPHGLQPTRLLHPWDLPGKSTAVGCHCLLPRQHINKQRHYFADKGPCCQRYGFSSMYGCESWTIKKADCCRIDAFELWCWRRFLRVPWTARRSNQSILKEINLEYSLEGLMLKLKLQYIGCLMWETDSFEKTLMLGKIEAGGEGDDRGWDGWMASLTQWTWVWVDSGSWFWTGRPGVLQFMGSLRVGQDWATELNWTEIWLNFFSKSQMWKQFDPFGFLLSGYVRWHEISLEIHHF